MMKWGFTINAGLGAVLVVSTLGAGAAGEEGLDLTLSRTVRQLESLAGIRGRLENGDANAVGDLLRMTDEPSGNPAAEEARLSALRLEVAHLQMIHDGLAPYDTIQDPKSVAKNGAKDRVQNAASKRSDATTNDHKQPAANGTSTTTGNAAPTPDANLTAYEPAGFTVDPVLQGEALFRAERFAECLSVLRKSPDEPRAQYWSARALEKLDKLDEAIALYTTLSARTDGGWAAARAKTDLEYLQWKRDADAKKTPTPTRGGSPIGAPATREASNGKPNKP